MRLITKRRVLYSGIIFVILLVVLGTFVHFVIRAFSPTPLEEYAEGGQLRELKRLNLPRDIVVVDPVILNAIVQSANAARSIPNRGIIDLQRSVYCPTVKFEFADGPVCTGAICVANDCSGFAFMPDSSSMRQLQGADYYPIFIPWNPGISQEIRYAALRKFGEAAGYRFQLPPYENSDNHVTVPNLF